MRFQEIKPGREESSKVNSNIIMYDTIYNYINEGQKKILAWQMNGIGTRNIIFIGHRLSKG